MTIYFKLKKKNDDSDHINNKLSDHNNNNAIVDTSKNTNEIEVFDTDKKVENASEHDHDPIKKDENKL